MAVRARMGVHVTVHVRREAPFKRPVMVSVPIRPASRRRLHLIEMLDSMSVETCSKRQPTWRMIARMVTGMDRHLCNTLVEYSVLMDPSSSAQ